MLSADQIVAILGLTPHPREGGFFLESYRSDERIPAELLPGRKAVHHCLGTAIYYLLTAETRSTIHRLASDEIFHFYLGDPVMLLVLDPDQGGQIVILGPDLAGGQSVQVVIPKATWFGACLVAGGKWSLMGTTMAPGFEYPDYEDGNRDELVQKFPEHADLITRLTLEPSA